jgi:RNA recognition motif-containing protein
MSNLKLFVGGIPYGWDEKEMARAFGVESGVIIQRDRKGASRGYGFVTLENHEKFSRCLQLDGKEIFMGFEKKTLKLRVKEFSPIRRKGASSAE